MSLSITERLLKRQKFDVKVGDETYSVRELPVAELRHLDESIPDDPLLKSFYVIGRSLVTDDPAYSKPSDESAADYAKRIQGMLAEVGTATLAQLSTAITRLGITPRVESLKKN